MLGPEHIRARVHGGMLELRPLGGNRRVNALKLAHAMTEAARASTGERRADVNSTLLAIEVSPAERRLASGLMKLVLDACEFGAPTALDSARLRRAVFELAAERRRALGPGVRLDRQALLDDVAAAESISAAELDRALYADLKSEERLVRAPGFDAEELLRRYEAGMRQAVLLRAVEVVADVSMSSPYAYRALFSKLKFRRLLHRIERRDEGYRIVIDGPYSLFESVTKYGLALALVLPALEASEKLSLTAKLRWGKTREPVTFRYDKRGRAPAESAEPPLADDVQALLDGFSSLDCPWQARRAEALLDLPGVGVCAPDLEFRRADSGARVFLEVLGFWSRDAVWRRVELAQKGLAEPVLFAVSSRLRVSEEVLDERASGALYVYRGVMNPRSVVKRLDALAERG